MFWGTLSQRPTLRQECVGLAGSMGRDGAERQRREASGGPGHELQRSPYAEDQGVGYEGQ